MSVQIRQDDFLNTQKTNKIGCPIPDSDGVFPGACDRTRDLAVTQTIKIIFIVVIALCLLYDDIGDGILLRLNEQFPSFGIYRKTDIVSGMEIVSLAWIAVANKTSIILCIHCLYMTFSNGDQRLP